MTKQIAVRLPDALVEYIDSQVSGGAFESRAQFVTKSVSRYRRYLRSLNDVEIYRKYGEDPDLVGLAEWASKQKLDFD